ncbi:hypothetical protein BGZ82_000839 [Podila clonocystis]|nr:hypothetical protein BGZ82_000839 [Podila clonocystis]
MASVGKQSCYRGPALLFSVENTTLTFRAALLPDQNPRVVKLITAELPIENFLTNTVVAGETLQMGTKILSLGGGNMVKREAGLVYFYAPGSQINVCYGEVTETAKVNKFAQVYPEDLNQLRAIGALVQEQTMATADRTIVRITVSLIGANPNPATSKQLDVTDPSHLHSLQAADQTHWRFVRAAILRAVEENWYEEPDEIRRTRLGVINSGAGTGKSSYPIVLHQKAYTMIDGGGTLYRYLKLAQTEQITLDVLQIFTKAIFFETFDHFVFFGDLGLDTLHKIGPLYRAALDQITTKEEYVELTGPLVVLYNVFHRWVNLTYSWHHNLEHPHRTEQEVADQPKLATYAE